jgi:hypothetical protein
MSEYSNTLSPEFSDFSFSVDPEVEEEEEEGVLLVLLAMLDLLSTGVLMGLLPFSCPGSKRALSNSAYRSSSLCFSALIRCIQVYMFICLCVNMLICLEKVDISMVDSYMLCQ